MCVCVCEAGSYLVSSYGVLHTQYNLVSFLLSREVVVEIIFFFLALEAGPAQTEEGGPPPPPASLSSSRSEEHTSELQSR